MTAASISDPARPHLSRGALLLIATFGASVLWYLFLPAFFYANAAIWIEGPFPALLGGALAYRLSGEARFPGRAWASLAGALVGMLGSIVVLGTAVFGPLDALAGLFALLRASLRLPFSALFELWGHPRFVYGVWSGLKPVLVWGGAAYIVWRLRQGGLAALLDGWGEQHAFRREQRLQHKSYRSEYLAAVRRGEPPPALPPILQASASVGPSLAQSYWLLRIAVLLVGAVGLFGSAYAVLGEGLADSVMSIFLRGLVGG